MSRNGTFSSLPSLNRDITRLVLHKFIVQSKPDIRTIKELFVISKEWAVILRDDKFWEEILRVSFPWVLNTGSGTDLGISKLRNLFNDRVYRVLTINLHKRCVVCGKQLFNAAIRSGNLHYLVTSAMMCKEKCDEQIYEKIGKRYVDQIEVRQMSNHNSSYIGFTF